MSENLTSKTITGLKWSYISTISTSVMQIGYTAIMARLLAPEAFGLIAMGGVILRFGSYFAQMGMGQALVQKKTITNEDIRSIFTSTFLLGLFFLLIFFILSPLAGLFFDNKEIIPVVRFLSLSFLLNGISTTSLNLLRRNFRFKSLALVDITSYIIGYGLGGILLAYNGWGVWSLVSASLLQSLTACILSYTATRHNVFFLFEWKVFKPLFSFGGRVSVIGFVEFVCSNFDTLFIGRVFGTISLGIYNRAYMLINLPMQYFTSSLSRVLLPSFSRIQDDTRRLKEVYLPVIGVVAFFLIPACIFILMNAEQIIWMLLGSKWTAAVAILQILALVTPFNLLSHFAAIVCEATAILNVKIYILIFHIVALVLLSFLLSFLGIKGIAYAVLISETFTFLAYQYVLKRVLQINISEYFVYYIPGVITAALIGVANYFLSLIAHGIEGVNIWLLLTSVILSGVLFVGIFFSVAAKMIRQEIKSRVIKLPANNRMFSFIISKL